MWLTYAFGSAFLAGITAILAKVGMGKTDSSLATAIRTIVVVIFSWLMVFLVGSQNTITQIGAKSLLFLVLSGLATGASWLCYFRALQLGDVNKVTPIDKSSTVLTMILAVIILHEALTRKMILAMVLILAGTFLMITKKESTGKSKSKSWFCMRYYQRCSRASHRSCKDRHHGRGVKSRYGDSNLRGTCHGMGGRLCDTQAESVFTDHL